MWLIRKILVPVDLSRASQRALSEASRYASAFGGSIDLLHVWSMPARVAPESVISGVGPNEVPLLAWLGRSAQEQLTHFESEAKKASVPIAAALCEPGDPATVIVERVRTGGYDLVVMSTHGRSGLSHLLLGSVTERVIRTAPCPVLTVRSEPSAEAA